jgi:hypothetical protein
VKIAIMGCIVNGPGEMADADFGYVGGAPGKINLYVGKTAIKFNIPEAEAVDRLSISSANTASGWRLSKLLLLQCGSNVWNPETVESVPTVVAMSKQRPNTRSRAVTTSTPKRRTRPSAAVIALALVVAGSLFCGGRSQSLRNAGLPVILREAGPTTRPVAVVHTTPDFQKLKGNWLRPDGGYVIEIRDVDDKGKMNAAYSILVPSMWPGPKHRATILPSRPSSSCAT